MQHARFIKSTQSSNKNDGESRPPNTRQNSGANKNKLSLSTRRNLQSLPPMQNSLMNANNAGSTLKIGRNSFDVLHSSPSMGHMNSNDVSNTRSPANSISKQKSSNNSITVGTINSSKNRNFTDPLNNPRYLKQDSIRSSSTSHLYKTQSASPSIYSPIPQNLSNQDEISLSQDPVQLMIWFHELRMSTEDVIIDQNVIPGLKIGDVCEIQPLRKAEDNNNSPNTASLVGATSPSQIPTSGDQVGTTNPPTLKNSVISTASGSSPTSLNKDQVKKLYFTIKNQNLLSSLKESTPASSKLNFQLSLISNPLQKLLDLLPRSLVQIRAITDLESIEADSIEIFIKDVNLSRDSMWNFSSSLVRNCVYIDQRLSFLNNRCGVVKYIYKNGQKILSAYIGENTKIVYRSESAKLTFLIQLSREMWHFEENGEIMFHKLVNTLFPKIFKNWRDKNTHHSITIVLFTSMDLTKIPWTSLGHGERPNNRRDYFRVVVDQINILHWDKIMANLRLEFANFKRDVMLNLGGNPIVNNVYNDIGFETSLNNPERTSHIMQGQQLPSVKGNILEAINLGLTLVTDRFRNTDLKHCLSHFVLITPGTGLFDVDYKLMLETSKKMHILDLALDLICLSQPPLHIVPLFRYKDSDQNGKLSYCVPTWCDISFYKDSSEFTSQWIPRCKIYELQMMGVMENNINDATVERLDNFNDPKSIVDVMDKYDNEIFNKPDSKAKNDKRKSHGINGHYKKRQHHKHKSIDLSGTLSLIKLNDNTSASTAKIDVGTNESSVLGTVTNIGSESSALSSLYTLNKVTDDSKSKVTPGSASFSPMSAALKSMRSTFNLNGSNLVKSSVSPSIQESSDNNSISKEFNEHNICDKISKPKGRKKPGSKRKDSHYYMTKRDLANQNMNMQTKGTHAIDNSKNKNFEHPNKFWVEIINPSQELHCDILGFLRSSRWNDVFPEKIRRKQVKWRSFQSPAALPTTTNVFPTKEQLQEDYTFQIYTVTLSWDNDLGLQSNQRLMREMIELRLALGFQICYSDLVKEVDASRLAHGGSDRVIKYFPQNDESCIGARIYLSLDDEIHRIYCESTGNLNVQLYKKRKTPEDQKVMLGYNEYDKEKAYIPLIRTRYADEYTPAHIDCINNQPKTYNWNQFDQLLAGYDDAIPEEKKEFHKMKFVVMPAEIPKNAFYINNDKLNDEEIRVEGLRRLIATIERGKYDPHKEGQPRKKEEILPEVSFYTGNLYDFLNDQAESYDSTGNQPSNSLMLQDGARFNKNIKLSQLAQELQSPGGVRLVDRTWHFKTHLHCFLGNELVSWIIGCFEDIDSREEATNFAQSLMDRGLLKHVENRHGLLDGYYFYEFQESYIDKNYKAEKSGWFGKKKTPSTSNMNQSEKVESDNESMKSPFLSPQDSVDTKKTNPQLIPDSEASSMADSSLKTKLKKKFILSRCVKYDADPFKKSFRPEIINVHYDRVHNPEHCYHIRLQWLNTTTKFIDDVIISWSRLCERYGLKLVETPWRELCTIPKFNPFHSFVDLRLALNPWLDPEFMDAKILKDNKFYYHLYLLKKSDFLLDNRSSIFFLKDHIDISYSWGKPIFQFAQYIHETGAYIVELRDNGDFFLAPNNIHLIRLNTLLTSMHDHDNIKSQALDSQKIMLNFRAACNDVETLKDIFREAKRSWREDYAQTVVPEV